MTTRKQDLSCLDESSLFKLQSLGQFGIVHFTQMISMIVGKSDVVISHSIPIHTPRRSQYPPGQWKIPNMSWILPIKTVHFYDGFPSKSPCFGGYLLIKSP